MRKGVFNRGIKWVVFVNLFLFCVLLRPSAIIAGYIGDIDDDGNVGLADLLVTLDILTNAPQQNSFDKQFDIDGSGVIGPENISFILQVLSHLRIPDCAGADFWYDRQCYPNQNLVDWGLGNTEMQYDHNDREYDWYIDQANTGTHSSDNCGPSSVTMAAKWYDSGFTKTAEDARNAYRPEGGWWYTSDIINYLTDNSIPNTTSYYTGTNQLKGIIQNGGIMILCIDTTYLTMNYNDDVRVDRFYTYSGGHFLVVKGVRTVDSNLYYEVYDPNNWGATYTDGSEKGKNRHYREIDLAYSIVNWWNYAIVIYPESSAYRRMEKWLDVVDPNQIEHKPGR